MNPAMLPALGPTGYARPLIQGLLIVAVLVVAFLLLRSQGARHQALRRILLVVFALAAVASIVFPQAWTALANLLGVGRGADLLLYVLIVAFLSYVATRYSRDRKVEAEMTRLARRIALDEAGPATVGAPVDGSDVESTDGAVAETGTAPREGSATDEGRDGTP